MLSLHPLPAFTDNYIWTLSTADGRALVVDPGDAAPVLAAAAQGLQPAALLVTHHHADHIGGVAELLAHFDIPCFAPDDERIPLASVRVHDGDVLSVAGFPDFAVMAVAGHTRSHVAYVGPEHLFCGDTLFSLGCGRLFEGTPAQMLASLERLAALPPTMQVCCTHEYTLANAAFALAAEPGNQTRDALVEAIRLRRDRGEPSLPSTLAIETACNPFLRIDAPGLRAGLAAHLGRDIEDRCERFAELRRWKDGFRA